jgi:hypothetical protein
MKYIKTITSQSPTEFDHKVNEFCENHKVFATQTHFEHGIIIAVLFYEEVDNVRKDILNEIEAERDREYKQALAEARELEE